MAWDDLKLTDGHKKPARIYNFLCENDWFSFEVLQEDDRNSVILDFTKSDPLDALIDTLIAGRIEAFGDRKPMPKQSGQVMNVEVQVDIVPNGKPLEDLLAAIKNMHKGN